MLSPEARTLREQEPWSPKLGNCVAQRYAFSMRADVRRVPHRRMAELPAGEATPVLQPLPRAARRHSQRLAVPASAQPPTLLVADIEGLQVDNLHLCCAFFFIMYVLH